MRYPSGFARHVLWGVTLLVCVLLAFRFEGHGLAMDWPILSALIVWHMRAMDQRERAVGPY